MAYKYREEIVGKRFLSVSGFTKHKSTKISEWAWRAGVIRAASHKDNTHSDLQVLVEYDDVEWQRREWISVYKDDAFSVFMVEQTLLWCERSDPFSGQRATALWPALSFKTLVDAVGVASHLQPVEFLLDRELAFRDYSRLQPFQEWNPSLPGVRDYPELRNAVQRWTEFQDGQRILVTTPSVLVGYRVEVYRAEGTTQWYTAVIVSYNEATRDLTVTDDTVLEDHNEDPCIVQMRLIGDGVVESIMRGENVGITPRRSRSSALFAQHQLTANRAGRGAPASSGSTPGVIARKPRSSKPDDVPATEKDRASCVSNQRSRLKRKGTEQQKEDVENKGNKKRLGGRGIRKKVLEEPNCPSRLRRHVQVRVQDCLVHKKEPEASEPVTQTPPDPGGNPCGSESSDEQTCVVEEPSPVAVHKGEAEVDPPTPVSTDAVLNSASEACGDRTAEVNRETAEEEESENAGAGNERTEGEDACRTKEEPIVEEPTQAESSSQDDDDVRLSSSSPFSRMDLPSGEATSASLLRFPDDRSDSGVSSLRSGSGDERSGSRSSALSSSDEPPQQQAPPPPPQPSTSQPPPQTPPSSGATDGGGKLPPPEPIRVWRDPNLLMVSEPSVRHINSVQHQTLLMSHPQSGSPAVAVTTTTAGHYPPPPPPLMNTLPLHPPHHRVHHLVPPPALPYPPEMLWASKRYAPHLPVGTHLLPPAHDEVALERAYVQDRDRILRERRELELEKQHKEREKEKQQMERERLELDKQRAATENAVQKHFEESLRLAHQKRSNSMCWNLISLPPPQRGTPAPEDDRKRPEHDQRYLAARDRTPYYNPAPVARPPSAPKVDYPPPAHSRISGSKPEKQSTSHSALPKAEPNFSLFGYANYPPSGFIQHESPKVKAEPMKSSSSSNLASLSIGKPGSASIALDRDREAMLSLSQHSMGDVKNSVIVKNEGKSPHHLEVTSKVPPPHSPSPKMLATPQSHYMTSVQHKAYEYRSPSQSPLHLAPRHSPSPHHSMTIEPQNLAKGLAVHHRTSQQPSPHSAPHRQSPHHMQQPPHSSPPDQRYPPGTVAYSKAATISSYQYPTSGLVTTSAHYVLPPGTGVSATSKPKVSSPAPHQIYGKPGIPPIAPGITTGTPVCRPQDINNPSPLPLTSKASIPSSVSPSPYQQMSQHHPPPQQQSSGLPPPPAHSSRAYDPRMYPGSIGMMGATGKLTTSHQGTSPPASSSPSVSRASPHHSQHPLSHPGMATLCQTQPLDLGVSDRGSNRDDSTGSPKRKSISSNSQVSAMGLDPNKKRRCDPVPCSSPLQQPIPVLPQPPLLARVSEPSPLIASAATTITTVVNTAAYCPPTMPMMVSVPHETTAAATTAVMSPNPIPVRTASGDGSLRPSSVGSNSGSAVVFPVAGSTPQRNSPAPIAPPSASNSPGLPTQQQSSTQSTPSKPPPSSADSEKSNSPGPTKPVGSSSYLVHKLKKAWLQRHSGEDGSEDTTGVVGSGSCVTLPLTLSVSNPSSVSTVSSKDNLISGQVNSIQNVGSMAVSSILKGKTGGPKGNSRKVTTPSKGESSVTLNGHASELLSNKTVQDDSSSSDQERELLKSPPKRKPKGKRKKATNTVKKSASEDGKRKKLTQTPASESGSDSEKESGSEKDSDSGASTNQSGGKKTANGGNSGSGGGAGGGKEPRKRGRRPKGSKNEQGGEEPRQKKSRDDPPAPQRNPFRKPPVSQLKKTGESFLQDGACHEVAPKLGKCRECRWTPNQRSRNMTNIFCRFYAFRRLRYTKNGQLAIAGFSDPHRDASEDDLKLWLPSVESSPADLGFKTSWLLLREVGDQFCDLLKQEEESLTVHKSQDKTIAWKRVVKGVREMCDVCETTLFNFHWACGKCGFSVCIDCYKSRKANTIRAWGESARDRDECSWLLCTNRQPHEQDKLMLTQIIAGDSLKKLGVKAHETRALYDIPQFCSCPLSKEVIRKGTNGINKELLNSLLKSEPVNGLIMDKKERDPDSNEKDKKNGTANGAVKQEEKNSPLSWLADVALSNEDKKDSDETGSTSNSSDDEDDKDGNYSTLRELLIRPSNKPNSRPSSPVNTSTPPPTKQAKKSRMDQLDAVISSVIQQTTEESTAPTYKSPTQELKHFVRRYHWQQKGREPLPIRIMTCTESEQMYPDTPHMWLCDGKLLRLLDPNCKGNYRVFQDQWKRGQPVIVSDVTKHLNMDLWQPESFARDFGDDKNDLVNCMTGNLVPNQPMRKFWEGFEWYSKRLKDDRGNPMLLKLKDWPPGDDFAEMLPSRFSDLMRVLPLAEYTHRTGRLNLASRLPECFVRPDLGPKMYNAYGSALHPSKGTTNLHLDISDAVNVMVYVGIPKDSDNDEQIKEALKAIDEAGCDILTRRRVRESSVIPGALWHIYHARDADKIRDLLNKVAIERGAKLEPHHDPIHDQSWYLDGRLRERLYTEYGVEGYAIVQCLGDSVFIPAGAPHQVRNLHNCIKVAEDFVSPENVSHCFHLTQEFRDLSDTHSNHEDKLQIKNIIYHAVKDAISILSKFAKKYEDPNAKDAMPELGASVINTGDRPTTNGNTEDGLAPAVRSPSNGEVEVKKELPT